MKYTFAMWFIITERVILEVYEYYLPSVWSLFSEVMTDPPYLPLRLPQLTWNRE